MTLRLLFITPRFGTIARGIEVFTAELAARLSRQGYRIAILSGPHDVRVANVDMIKVPLLRRESVAQAYRPEIISKIAHKARVAPAEVEVATLLWNARNIAGRADNFDVVIPLGGAKSTRWARRMWPKASIVCVGQAGVVATELRWADAFVALIGIDASTAASRFPNLTIETIPNGVDLVRFVPSLAPPTDLHIVCAGAFVRDKGHHYLLDALLHLPDSVRLSCVGTGSVLNELSNHPACAGGRVRFFAADHKEMPSIYQSARAFTLPAMGEAFGIVFVEALACGLPVVAHDGPRQRDVVGDGGYFADVRDARGYAAALMRALKAGPRQVRDPNVSRLAWDTIADRYAAFLEQLVAGSRLPGGRDIPCTSPST